MDTKYMNLAFKEAQKAFELNEVPIGAVIVKDDKIISKAHNLKESKNCCTAHAEILAIEKASKKIDNWRLEDCDLYVTLDPCPMCASAIKQARIKNVYSAAKNSDSSYTNIINSILTENDSVSPKLNFLSNLMVEKSKNILNNFFKKQRNR